MLETLSHQAQYLIAEDRLTNLSDLEVLSRSSDELVRGAVASNPSASDEIFEFLSKDEDPEVRACVAENKSAPYHIVDRLQYDSDRLVSDLAEWEINRRQGQFGW